MERALKIGQNRGNVSAMTNFGYSRSVALLVLGDIIALVFSLIFTLTIRYGHIPGRVFLSTHLSSFILLWVIFLLIAFSAGLYDKQALFVRGKVHSLLMKAQLLNLAIGVAFFYLAPVAIAPKANLAIYFIVSTGLLYLWRAVMYPVMSASRNLAVITIGAGPDMEALEREIDESPRYSLSVVGSVRPSPDQDKTISEVRTLIDRVHPSVIVADLRDRSVEQIMPFLYALIFSGTQILDAGRLYETVFDRIPLSFLGERWLVEHSAVALGSRSVYDTLKRALDVVLGGFGALVSLVFYPFVALAIKLDDKGPIFITQERIGVKGKLVRIVKFRSMSGNDNGDYSVSGKSTTSTNHVTRVGAFIRKARIDELPQLWNVLRGDLSLIGPRPELPSLVSVYEKEIPYYSARHLVKPGLSGWAQIYHDAHPHHAIAAEETRDKLSYDLYYVKNRSLTLDLKIVFRTLQILMSQKGR